MSPPLIMDYAYPNIVTMLDTNFNFIIDIGDIDESFKTLINIIDIIIKENKKLKYEISLFKKLFKYPKHVISILDRLQKN